MNTTTRNGVEQGSRNRTLRFRVEIAGGQVPGTARRRDVICVHLRAPTPARIRTVGDSCMCNGARSGACCIYVCIAHICMHTCIRDSALAMGTSFGEFRTGYRISNLLNKSLICFLNIFLFLFLFFFFLIYRYGRKLMEFCWYENF